MTTEITEDTLEKWLLETPYDDVEEVSNDEVEFQFVVRQTEPGLSANIIKTPNAPFIEITVRLPIEPDVWATLLDLGYERRQLKISIGNTLTNAPGTWTYLDDDLQPTTFENARYISLTDRIYPNGGDQQRFVDSITDLFGTILFIQQAMRATRNAIQERT